MTYEPAGVAALITPWNWPMNQVVLKVGAALAAGCTMVLKPSEVAPMSSILFSEIIHEAGFPPVSTTWSMVMVPALAASCPRIPTLTLSLSPVPPVPAS